MNSISSEEITLASIPQSPAPPRHRTVAGLDLLRLAAALLVVCYHYLFFSWVEPRGHGGTSDAVGMNLHYLAAVPYTSWGWIGVDLFFVISGFVITMSSKGKHARDFAAGRFARLFPTLFFFATLSLAVVLGAGLLPVSHALIAWVRAVTLFPKGPWIDGVIWTLTIEAIFYGLIFLALLHHGRDRLPLYSKCALGIIAVFWATVFITNFMMAPNEAGELLVRIANAYWARVILLSTGPFFLLGMFAFEASSRGLTRQLSACIAIAFSCCLMVVYTSANTFEGITKFRQSPFVPLLVWAGLILLCGLSVWAEQRRPPGRRFRSVARRLGLMTYPLYLVHDIPGGWVLGHLARAGLNRWLAASVTILLALAFSYVFAIAIEPRLKQLLGINRLTAWVRARHAMVIPPPVSQQLPIAHSGLSMAD